MYDVLGRCVVSLGGRLLVCVCSVFCICCVVLLVGVVSVICSFGCVLSR